MKALEDFEQGVQDLSILAQVRRKTERQQAWKQGDQLDSSGRNQVRSHGGLD